jgi:hypothetical protein
VALAVLAASGGQCFAAKLDREACKSLGAEVDSLITAGVKADMDRGPEWGKANLAPARLEDIKRLIELGEQLEFRCGAGGTDGARLARKPDADDDDSKGAGPKRVKRSKRGAQRSDALPAPASLGAATAAQARQAGTAAGGGFPGAQAGKPLMPVRTLDPAAAKAKIALRPIENVAAGEGGGDDDVAAPSLGNAAAGPGARQGHNAAEAPAAPTLGKAGTTSTKVEASHHETAAEEPPTVVPSVNARAAPAGPKSAATPAAADVPSLGKATATVATGEVAAANKKPQRRRSNTTYVAPTDVNPGFLNSYGNGH